MNPLLAFLIGILVGGAIVAVVLLRRKKQAPSGQAVSVTIVAGTPTEKP